MCDDMKIVKSRSSIVQPYRIIGPTIILINRDQELETIQDPDGRTRQEYVCTQYRISPGEYELIRAGILPIGASWDAELRRIERSALLDNADTLIAKAEDLVATGQGDASLVQRIREYKMAVRATVDQPNFPESAEYPEVPRI